MSSCQPGLQSPNQTTLSLCGRAELKLKEHFFFFSNLQEVITVRVQDPRVQNEGSWNSYVDYKIFLHVSQALVMGSAAGLWAVLR